MDKLNEFKEFVKDKPFLNEKVKNKETTWQNLYETYDLYGKDADAFKEDKQENDDTRNNKSILKMLEGVNMDKISENLEGMKKILGVLGEFSKKDVSKENRRTSFKGSRRFDD